LASVNKKHCEAIATSLSYTFFIYIETCQTLQYRKEFRCNSESKELAGLGKNMTKLKEHAEFQV
jgi:hypothetical protein